MSAVLPILSLALAGMLLGGAYSLFKQGASKPMIGFVGLLGLVAAAGGVLWLIPEG